MGLSSKGLVKFVMLVLLAAPFAAAWAAGDVPTKFTNRDSIRNTRHNMTQGTMSTAMDPYRNNYGEVCVYCHTPHGANEAVNIDDLITQARVYVETVQRVMGDGL